MSDTLASQTTTPKLERLPDPSGETGLFRRMVSLICSIMNLSLIQEPIDSGVSELAIEFYKRVSWVVCNHWRTELNSRTSIWLEGQVGVPVLFFSGLTGAEGPANAKVKAKDVREILYRITQQTCHFPDGVFHCDHVSSGSEELGPAIVIVMFYMLMFRCGLCCVPGYLFATMPDTPMTIVFEGGQLRKDTIHLADMDDSCGFFGPDGTLLVVKPKGLHSAVHELLTRLFGPLILPFCRHLIGPNSDRMRPSIQRLWNIMEWWGGNGYNAPNLSLSLISCVWIDVFRMVVPYPERSDAKRIVKVMQREVGIPSRKMRYLRKRGRLAGMYEISLQFPGTLARMCRVEGFVLFASTGSILYLRVEKDVWIYMPFKLGEHGYMSLI